MARFRNFSEFYAFYLSEHADRVNRRWHFCGTAFGLAGAVLAPAVGNPRFVLLGLVLAYACAWVGHYFYEKNRPATFRHPFYSLAGDVVMFKDILLRRLEL